MWKKSWGLLLRLVELASFEAAAADPRFPPVVADEVVSAARSLPEAVDCCGGARDWDDAAVDWAAAAAAAALCTIALWRAAALAPFVNGGNKNCKGPPNGPTWCCCWLWCWLDADCCCWWSPPWWWFLPDCVMSNIRSLMAARPPVDPCVPLKDILPPNTSWIK